MVDAITVLAVALLVAAVAGTVVPLVPGGLLSLAGVYLYWWHSGFTEPGALTLAVLTLLGVLTLLVEFFGGSIAAKAGGASWGTTAAAAAVGIVLMVVTGPIGLLVGLFGTVFALEFVRDGNVDESAQSALYATGGMLASTAAQALLTATVLFGFLIAVFLL
ncbi:hypothetical protein CHINAEXTREME_11345 [Halobiforma lacisalsi AJ5]|uniref:DUF456 domain-containing protein n=1 Tax=Natronobacterium lacisalsi AJ5 TaxID=358396 RepID=M0L684_NATLA|nr:DUF456 domain-containing protein [Halobiforma lacisalsi]APW98351.1 hypothetical protein CHINAEXTREME_11345 [Halobiforma lacisalsi AJ5]EMA27954.1 hypothetical protein C445_19917 [Halobiforma lacisalsi AJ5]